MKSTNSFKIFQSTFIVAVLFFFVLDLFIRFDFKSDRYELPDHNYIWWAVKGFKELKRTPDILLFGSSLVVAFVNDGDAAYLKHPIDGVLHHRSLSLEHELTNQHDLNMQTYSFAVGGQMASDVYAIERTLINKENRPKLIIWGIAPRDFLDAAFDGPSSSDTALYMNRLAQTSIIPPDHTSFPWYIEQALNKISMIFQNRSDFLSWQKKSLRSLQSNKKKDLSSLPPSQNLAVGDWIIPVCTEYSHSLKDNKTEYHTRYNPFKPKTFKTQLAYLNKDLAFNQALGIKIILVNMPLTSQNLALMPAGIYQYYLAQVEEVAKKYNATFVDLNRENLFAEKEFSDTAHLNGLGGQKLAKVISQNIHGI